MKTNIIFFTISLLYINFLSAQNNQKEVLIVGTMHTVPTIVKNSYKPMLKRAVKYNPEAIYIESPMANDTISWEYLKEGWSKSYRAFYKKSDSFKKTRSFNETVFRKLAIKKYKELTKEEINYLIKSYLYNRDYGNYKLMIYLKTYGLKGSKKPTRNENGDLTFMLALIKNLKVLNMDDQQTNSEYHNAWRKCAESGAQNGDNDLNRKLNKRDYNSAIIPAIFGNLGRHTNKLKSLDRKHLLNSFRYVQNTNLDCENATRYWDERNFRMAKNIAEQVTQKEHKKNIIVVGAGHVIGLKEAFEKKYPELKIKLMYE